MTKDKTSFARTDHIVASAKKVFSKLAEEDYLDGLGSDEFIERLAHYYSELNVIHPFREGNGRAIRTLLTMLAENLGWSIAWNEISPQENVTACIAAYNNDEMPLRDMLRKIVEPIDPFWGQDPYDFI